MKKFLVIFIFIFCFFFFSVDVKADSFTSKILLHNNNYSYEKNKSFYENNKEILSHLYNDVYNYYSENYKNDYPYYLVNFSSNNNTINSISTISISFYLFSTIPSVDLSGGSYGDSLAADYVLKYSYSFENSSYILPIVADENSGDRNIFFYIFASSYLSYYNYYYSNFDLILNLGNYDSFILVDYSHLGIPDTFKFSYSNGDRFIPLQEAMNLNIINDPDSISSSYREINLNNYAYVILSLKDYSQTKEIQSIFSVKGQLCSTPVYNFGFTERKNIISGSKNERCSLYFDDFTPVRYYISDRDLKNHSIYYLKAYDTTKENIVKIDTSIYDIHLITEENKNNPLITINGRTYSPIPYDELTDTATKSEDEEYNSGVSEEFNFSLSFSDIFKSPIEFLKNIWSSVVNIFTIINYFISILPSTIQYFLYVSFVFAIVLGLIKIIL